MLLERHQGAELLRRKSTAMCSPVKALQPVVTEITDCRQLGAEAAGSAAGNRGHPRLTGYFKGLGWPLLFSVGGRHGDLKGKESIGSVEGGAVRLAAWIAQCGPQASSWRF